MCNSRSKNDEDAGAWVEGVAEREMLPSLASTASLYTCHLFSRQQQQQQQILYPQLHHSDFPKLLISKHNLVPLSKCKCLPCVSAWATTPQHVLQQVPKNKDIPTSAAAIAAAINAVASYSTEFSQRTDNESKGIFTGPSADFLELCRQQLAICDKLFGHKAKFMVYIRPVESYGTPDLELRLVAAHPKWTLGKDDESLVLVGNYETADVLRSAESALLEKEAVELPEFSALVVAMVKDLFLVGFLVAEWIAPEDDQVFKSSKLRAVRPEWPPHKGSSQIQPLKAELRAEEKKDETARPSNAFTFFTPEQESEGRKIARSLAIGCVMDQRTLLLQQSSWQRGVRVGDLLEQIRGPLAAIRTLGRMLQPQMKKGEISSDVLEDILVQGEQMKNVVQQFQEVIYYNENSSTMLCYKEKKMNDIGLLNAHSSEREPEDRGLAVHDGTALKQKPDHPSSMISLGHSGQRDKEAPMPPVALAPLMHTRNESCDVSKILIDLVNSGAVLAHKKGQALELKQNPDDAPYYAAMDEFSLRQAFSNLLDSSLQHILPGGWVKVEVMRAPGGVLVIIDDNGPDLSLMSQAQALAPFGSGLRVGGGQGRIDTPLVLSIGAELNIAQDILEQFGGVLRITSPLLPKAFNGIGGTRLEVWLPSPTSVKGELSS